MGRPRTPTRILEMRGAFRKNPARGRARADSADNVFSAPRRKPFPPMPEDFEVHEGAGALKCRRLSDIWNAIERQTRYISLHEDNFEKLGFVCELLLKCRHGRASEDQRALAGRWLAVLRMPASFADKVSRA